MTVGDDSVEQLTEFSQKFGERCKKTKASTAEAACLGMLRIKRRNRDENSNTNLI